MSRLYTFSMTMFNEKQSNEDSKSDQQTQYIDINKDHRILFDEYTEECEIKDSRTCTGEDE